MVTRKMVNSQFWAEKVFVTGHTGFKGAWLSYWLGDLVQDRGIFKIYECSAEISRTA